MQLEYDAIPRLGSVYLQLVNFEPVRNDPNANLLAGSHRDFNVSVIRVHHNFRLSADWVTVLPLFSAGKNGE
jgi:hypothetical protein